MSTPKIKMLIPRGKDGNDGLSAYEIALNNGFEGTEDEWLDSLAGKDGHNVKVYSHTLHKIYSQEDLDNLCASVADETELMIRICGETIDLGWVLLYTGNVYSCIVENGAVDTIRKLNDYDIEVRENTLLQFTFADDLGVEKEEFVPIFSGTEGLSAYEIAVKNGYEGTEEEWITKVSNPISHETLYSVETQADLDGLISSFTNGKFSFVVTGEVEVTIEDPGISFGPGFAFTVVYTDGVLTDWTAHGEISLNGSMFTVYDENSSEKKIFVMNGRNGKDGVSPTVQLEEITDGTGYILSAQNDDEEEPTEVPIFHGKTPNLTIGTVTTLAAGKSATASITGTAENPVLNLGIPKGAKGADGEDGVDGGSEAFEMIGTYDISGGIIDVSFASLKKIAVYFSVPAGYTGTSVSVLVYLTTNSANEPVLCHGHAVATTTQPFGGRIDVEGRPWYSVKSVLSVVDASSPSSTDPYTVTSGLFCETIAPYHINTPIQRLKLALVGGSCPSGSTVILCGVKA